MEDRGTDRDKRWKDSYTDRKEKQLRQTNRKSDGPTDRQTDRQQGVLLTSDVCLQWGHTEMFKMLQERSVMEERKENLDEERNNTGQ